MKCADFLRPENGRLPNKLIVILGLSFRKQIFCQVRIWSIHPRHLDAKGLVALWRETLLAKHVLEGKTKGYKNHPQLDRFKSSSNPLDSINSYLAAVYDEASTRGYNFNKDKINWKFKPSKMSVTNGQFEYETEHLLKKLKLRDRKKYEELIELDKLKPHPLFKIRKGGVEDWEVAL